MFCFIKKDINHLVCSHILLYHMLSFIISKDIFQNCFCFIMILAPLKRYILSSPSPQSKVVLTCSNVDIISWLLLPAGVIVTPKYFKLFLVFITVVPNSRSWSSPPTRGTLCFYVFISKSRCTYSSERFVSYNLYLVYHQQL